MKKINNYILIGLFFVNIFNFGNAFNIMPEFFKGVFAALGIGYLMYGALAENYDVSKIKNYKKNLFSRIAAK